MDDQRDWDVRRIRHVVLDVVAFSRKDRSADDQVMIICAVNNIIRNALNELKVREEDHVLLPTGDGICICLLVKKDTPEALHLTFATMVLQEVKRYNRSQGTSIARQFDVRIGLNEHHDCVIKDINGNVNIAGYGINLCQRIMNVGNGNNILLGRKAYEVLPEAYRNAIRFAHYMFTGKHAVPVEVYQFVDGEVDGLNTEHPADLMPYEEVPEPPSMAGEHSSRFLLSAADHKGSDEAVEVPVIDPSVLYFTLAHPEEDQAYILYFHFRTSLNEKGWIGFSSDARPDRIWTGDERTEVVSHDQGPGQEMNIKDLIRKRWPEFHGEATDITRLRLKGDDHNRNKVTVSVKITVPDHSWVH
jgi:class 3 adenylate cyclase